MTLMPLTPRDRRLWLGLPLAAALLVGTAGPVGAVPFLDSRYGSQAAFLLPEINGMGGTGLALYRGAVSNVLNPACLVEESGGRLDGAVGFEQEHEDRFTPLYDSFDDIVNDTAIASNRHHYFDAGFGFARRLVGARAPLTVGLSLTDRYSFAYDFQEELRDPDTFSDPRDRILQNRAHEVDGTLRALSGGGAVALSPVLALGAALHYSFGTQQLVRQVRDFRSPAASSFEETAADLDGLNFTLGARLEVSQRLTLGLAYESPLDVSGNQVTESFSGATPDEVLRGFDHLSVQRPRSYGAGLTLRPRSEPRTVLSADAVFTPWSDLEDSRIPGDENPQLLEDTFDVRVGVEHTFYNGVPLRFGFRHLDSYSDREASADFFTAGIGLPTAGGVFSASLELSKIVSNQEHLFAYPDDTFVSTEIARVEDTRFRFGVGFTRTF